MEVQGGTLTALFVCQRPSEAPVMCLDIFNGGPNNNGNRTLPNAPTSPGSFGSHRFQTLRVRC